MSTDRVEKAREAVRKWKARAADAKKLCEELEMRAVAAEGQIRIVKRQVVSARRDSPSVALLRLTFGRRLKTLSARRGPANLEHEERLLQRSNPYRAVVDGQFDAADGGAQRGTLEGLVWWTRGGQTDSRLPYRAIMQTRETGSGGVMLDLGANVGRMAIPRVILGDVTRVYCAEPDPLTFACLARNVIDNHLRGLVLPDQIAISDRDGIARLLRSGHSGNFRLVPDDAEGNIVEVPCRTLDTWVAQTGIDLDSVTFIKVDVEGSERRVLAGAAGVLARSHIAWQIEVKPSWLRSAGDDPEALYTEVQRWFTHFIDLNKAAAGRRVRPVVELSEALAYIEPDGKTDVLLFSAAGARL
jgi:FkbM family methyltransferase